MRLTCDSVNVISEERFSAIKLFDELLMISGTYNILFTRVCIIEMSVSHISEIQRKFSVSNSKKPFMLSCPIINSISPTAIDINNFIVTFCF